VIGLITPLRNLIIGTVAPFRVIQDSLTLLGDGAIPAMTLILGGNLLKGMRRSEVRSSEMKNSCIIGVLVARYILLPVSGVLLVRGAYKLDLVTSEPLYQFVLLLQYAVPPAMNLGTKTQLFGAGESECSVIMLWTYSLAAVSLTVWPTFFMWLVT
jgi:predicted permease